MADTLEPPSSKMPSIFPGSAAILAVEGAVSTHVYDQEQLEKRI